MPEGDIVPRRRARVAIAAAVTALVALTLSSCSSADDGKPDDAATSGTTPTGTDSGSGSSEPTGVVVDITFQGDTVDPNGERIDAKVGEPVTLNIDADAPGELHIHSTPEQQVAFKAGTSTHKVTFDQPGVVDVESHELDKVVIQVEVR